MLVGGGGIAQKGGKVRVLIPTGVDGGDKAGGWANDGIKGEAVQRCHRDPGLG